MKPDPHKRTLRVLAFVAAVGLAAFPIVARPPQPQAGGKPDILGITTGMSPQDALNIMREHDPGHSVALTQWTIPQLYGDKPFTLGLNTATTGMEVLFAQLTVPPNPQVVWDIHRDVPAFTSTTPNVLKSLVDKYGTPWTPYSFPGAPPRNQGQLLWLYDAQGHMLPSPANQADSQAMQTCLGQVMQEWYGAFTNMPNPVPSNPHNNLVPGNPRTSVQTVPPVFDPSKNTLCNSLLQVKALINGGIVQPGDLRFTLNITIDDFGAQHRAGIALNDALNAVVTKGAQQQRDDASQQTVPKL